MDPVTALAIGSTVAGAATSAVSARRQNQAIERSMASQREASAVQQRQLIERAQHQQTQRQREATRARASIRLAAAEAGVGMGGSTAALTRTASMQAEQDVETIEGNLQNQLARVRSGFEANAAQLQANVQSPALAGLQGGLGGAQTGLAIGGGIRQIQNMPSGEAPQSSPLSSAQRIQGRTFRNA